MRRSIIWTKQNGRVKVFASTRNLKHEKFIPKRIRKESQRARGAVYTVCIMANGKTFVTHDKKRHEGNTRLAQILKGNNRTV